MNTKDLVEKSIYFKHNKLLGLPIEIKDDTILLDTKYTIKLNDETDILESVFESDIRKDKGTMFNIRSWLFNFIKSYIPEVYMDRQSSQSCFLSLVDTSGVKINIRNTNQLKEFIKMV